VVYVGKSERGTKLHIARFPWKPGPAWCGVQIVGRVHFKFDAEDSDVCRLCLRNIDSHLDAKYGGSHPRAAKGRPRRNIRSSVRRMPRS